MMTVLVRIRYICDFCKTATEVVECGFDRPQLPDGWTTVHERSGDGAHFRVLIRDCCSACAVAGFPIRTEKPTSPRRTKSQVMAQRRRFPHAGCCDRYADNKGCDCLETAEDDL